MYQYKGPFINDVTQMTHSFQMKVREHFPHRLYEMLEYATDCGHPLAISWTDDGRGFTIHQKDKFLEHIVPVFFKQTKF